MAHCCFKQSCELEVQYVCLCLSFETYCCEFHLQAHLRLPNRVHTFHTILINFPKGAKDIILGYFAKEKSKKAKLKKIALASFGQNWNNHKYSIEDSVKELDSELKEISCLIENINQISDKTEDPILNQLALQNYNDAEIAESRLPKGSETYTKARLLYKLGQLKNKRDEILNRTNNDQETEQEFRKTCSLYENLASNSLFMQSYQEYINSYQKIAFGYLLGIDQDGIKSNLRIYNTENEQEEVKVFENPEKFKYYNALAQLPNGELFIIASNGTSRIAFIIDRYYKFRKLPCEVPQECWTSIYFNRNVYCFGGEDGSDRLYCNWRFDFDENRRYELASIQEENNQCLNCLIANRNILISMDGDRNIFLYSIDIDSFSKIPYSFTANDKWLIKAEEKLYIIEWEGWIYESYAEDVYTWKQISKSIFQAECPSQFYCSYNKGAVYISVRDSDGSRLYFKFDLNRKTLIDIALYSDKITLKRTGDKLEAMNCYYRAFSFNPDLAATYISKGYNLHYLADNLSNLERWSEYLKCSPNNAVGWSCKGGALCDLDRYVEALECYNESLKLNPENVKEHHNKANALLKLERNLEALECFNEAIRLAPDSDYVYFNKGVALYDIGLYQEAIESYNEAVRHNPNNIDAYFYKGLALQILNRNFEAVESYNEIINLEPGNHNVLILKGLILMKLDRNLEAIECFNEVLKLKPDSADAYINKGIALNHLGKKLEAIECYKDAIKLEPENVESYIQKGITLANLGKHIDAIKCYDEAIRLKPDYASAYNQEGIALFELGRIPESIICYNEAIKLDPGHAEAFIRKGVALGDLGQNLEAIECYNEAIKIKPDYACAYNNKGVALSGLGKGFEAIECYNEAIKLKPELIDTYINKAATLFGLDRYIEVIECYNVAISLKPDDSELYRDRSIIYSLLGRQIDSLQDFKKAGDLMWKSESKS